MSPAMLSVLKKLEAGPIVLGTSTTYLETGEMVWFGHRVSSRTFDGLEKRGLVGWHVIRSGYGLLRVYELIPRTKGGDA